MKTFRCDGCKKVVDAPTLRIERIDGLGGGGVRILPGSPWDLCLPCAQALDGAFARLGIAERDGAK